MSEILRHLSSRAAERLGLTEHTAVSAGAVTEQWRAAEPESPSGSMMLVMGDFYLPSDDVPDFHSFDGVCSVAADGMVPGLYGYESGQPATGDLFEWFAGECDSPGIL